MTQPHIAVIGAGAMGGWTAWHLQQKGANVTLIDAWGPGHSRASSGGETRFDPRYLRSGSYLCRVVDSCARTLERTWKALARISLPSYRSTLDVRRRRRLCEVINPSDRGVRTDRRSIGTGPTHKNNIHKSILRTFNLSISNIQPDI